MIYSFPNRRLDAAVVRFGEGGVVEAERIAPMLPNHHQMTRNVANSSDDAKLAELHADAA